MPTSSVFTDNGSCVIGIQAILGNNSVFARQEYSFALVSGCLVVFYNAIEFFGVKPFAMANKPAGD